MIPINRINIYGKYETCDKHSDSENGKKQDKNKMIAYNSW